MIEKKIKIIEVPSELGAGSRGASLGPQALRLTDMALRSNIITRHPFSRLDNYNDGFSSNHGDDFAKNIKFIQKIIENLAAVVTSTLDEGFFPIVLSGDHSNAAGTIAGIKDHYPEKTIGVIWIDAHADLHSPYTTPSGNMHGMPLAASLGIDNIEDKINQVPEDVASVWEKIKRAGSGGICPKISPDSLVFIDIRDLEEQEWNLINRNNIKFFTPQEVNRKGIRTVASETLDSLKHCDKIYVSFDVDCLDPSVSKGTGTPFPDGLSESQALELLRELIASPKICGMEFTEINPLLDSENKMSVAILKILNEILPKPGLLAQ